MFAVTDFCQSPLKRSLVQQTIVSQRSSGFMQGLADGNDFRGCRDLHTSSRAPLEDQLWFRGRFWAYRSTSRGISQSMLLQLMMP
uniref:Uncharacterized protein n=1 Tax=Triticum urartu TaxID=4572 RepID=A0A8R7U335_TRIUA